MTSADFSLRPMVTRLQYFTEQLHGPLLVALAYLLGAEVAFYIGTLSDHIFALFWPPNVILFCALLIAQQRRWWLYLVCRLLLEKKKKIEVGMHWPQLLVEFDTNCLVVIWNAYGVRQFVVC